LARTYSLNVFSNVAANLAAQTVSRLYVPPLIIDQQFAVFLAKRSRQQSIEKIGNHFAWPAQPRAGL
jgi:hypothetical protein